MFSSQALKQRALEMGFNMVGITPAVPSPTLNAYLRWIDAGMQGTMGYLARPDRQARRQDLNVILPGVRSLVIVGFDYRQTMPENMLNDPSRGRIASYAWGVDYHDILTPKLEALAEWLRIESGQAHSHRVYVDTGAVLERSHAQQAGLGFIGKNTMLINPRRGSYFFLGEMLTDLEFDEYDKAHKMTMCGSCTRCLNACPTDAFPQPHVLDARRCISYLTIEHKGWIERELRPLMGNWIFGCDVCQDVCPFQRFSTSHAVSQSPTDSNVDRYIPTLLDILQISPTDFQNRYHGTPIYRIKRERLVRNACIAAGNWRHADAVEPLAHLLEDASPLIRGHAVWALSRIAGTDAILRSHAARETDAEVQAEIALANAE